MARSGFTLLWTLAALGCGARSMLDPGELFGNGASVGAGGSTFGGSAAGTPGGNSAAGGSSGVAAAPAVPPEGPPPATGSGGTGSVVTRAPSPPCENYCSAYAAVCNLRFGTDADCMQSCLSDLEETPGCRLSIVRSLECRAGNINTSLGCAEAVGNANDACFDLVEEEELCRSDPDPDPTPPCQTSESATDSACTSTTACPEGSYYISCYRSDDGLSLCDCSSDFGDTHSWGISEAPNVACAYAAVYLCKYPY